MPRPEPVWQVVVDLDAAPYDPADLDRAVAELLLSLVPNDAAAVPPAPPAKRKGPAKAKT
jgi:hypothetical protein